jgi:glycosyltransferase involved in cell wall biosynthesis
MAKDPPPTPGGSGGVPPGVATVQVILPCLNEAAALPWVLGRMPADYVPIVVDNGSSDGSVRIAADHGAMVISAPRRGYGAACHAGLLAATADVIALMDCDASLDPRQLGRVIEPVRRGAVDLMLGCRRPTSARAFPFTLRLANREVARRVRRRTGVALTDLGPMRAARRQPLLELGMVDRRSGYSAEMVVRAAEAGWRIAEIAVDYRVRVGRSKVTGTPLGAWRAVRDVASVISTPTIGRR